MTTIPDEWKLIELENMLIEEADRGCSRRQRAIEFVRELIALARAVREERCRRGAMATRET